jgi:hypothetical protein
MRLLIISSNVVYPVRIILIFYGSAGTFQVVFSALTAERHATLGLANIGCVDPHVAGRRWFNGGVLTRLAR